MLGTVVYPYILHVFSYILFTNLRYLRIHLLIARHNFYMFCSFFLNHLLKSILAEPAQNYILYLHTLSLSHNQNR